VPGSAATRDPRLLPSEMAWWLAAGGRGSDTSEHVLTEVWRRAAQKDIPGLRRLADGLERLAFPAGSCSVSRARCGGLIAANIVVAISALEVHLALAAGKLPRWSRRVVALMSPALRSEVAAWSSLALLGFRTYLSGRLRGTFVYALYNSSTLYIGKTNSERGGAQPSAGLVVRFLEHLLCLAQPRVKDGDRRRYKLLRRQPLRCLRFLPSVWWPSEAMGLHAERLAIAMLAPAANDKILAAPIRRRRTRVRRRPLPDRRDRSTAGCVW